MDNLTQDLLTKWDCSEYINKFKDGKVDSGILRILTDCEIAQLISVPGDRARFKENLKNWNQELNNLQQCSSEHPMPFDCSLGSVFQETVDLIDGSDPNTLQLNEPTHLPPQVGDLVTEAVTEVHNNQWKSNVTSTQESAISSPIIWTLSTPNVTSTVSSVVSAPTVIWTPASSQTHHETFQHGYVLRILSSTLDGKAILSKREIGKLEEAQRNLLVKLIIQPLLEKDPNCQITNKQLLKWSLEIQEIFKKESAALYYTPYVSALVHTTASNASGKLLRFIYNKRRQLRERGIIEPSTRSRSSSRSSSTSAEVSLLIRQHGDAAEATEEVTETLDWLRNSLEPWQLVQKNWSLTAKYRLSKSYLCGETVQELFNEYPALKLPCGYTLLLDDFNHLYPEKSDGLYSKIPILREKIKAHVEKKISTLRDKDIKQAIEEYLKTINDTQDLEVKNNGALLLLPYITSSVPLKERKKVQWRPSKTEIRDGFITQIGSDADLESTVSMRKEKLARYGRTLQPFVIFVGPSIAEISHCFVVAGDIYYKISKLITAVDVCFKVIHATGARYQDEAIVIWMVIQKAFYDIVTPYDKDLTSVKSLLIDLTL